MVLVDSSVWIRLERSPVGLDQIVGEIEVATCPIVVFEVLRGTHPARYAKTRAMLMSAELLDDPTPFARFEQAARLYLQCREAGITPSTGDCLVAACAIAHRVPLLHNDNDFTHIARVAPLQLFTRS